MQGCEHLRIELGTYLGLTFQLPPSTVCRNTVIPWTANDQRQVLDRGRVASQTRTESMASGSSLVRQINDLTDVGTF